MGQRLSNEPLHIEARTDAAVAKITRRTRALVCSSSVRRVAR